MIRSVVFGSLSVCWLIFILFLSHQKGKNTAVMSMRITQRIASSDITLEYNDYIIRKLAHFGCYFILTGLAVLAYASLLMPYCCIIVALLDEATKDLVPGRHCHLIDIFINIAGILAGCVFMLCSL